MKNTHRLLVSTIGILLTFSLNAHAEFWGQDAQASSEAEIAEAQEALNEKGIQLFDVEENCQLSLSRVVEGRLIITYEGISKLKKQGEYVLFRFMQTECVGEADCINFLLEGKVNLTTGKKTVENMAIEHSKTSDSNIHAGTDQYDYNEGEAVGSEAIDGEEPNPEVMEKKQRNFGDQGKPIQNLRPLVMYTEVETNTLIPSIVCSSAGESTEKPVEQLKLI